MAALSLEPGLGGRFAAVVERYPNRVERSSVEPVEDLRAAADVPRPPRAVVVVGTNGKTSTATYLERLFRAAGLRTGLTVSPHIRDWSERVRIDGAEVEPERFLAALERLDRRAEALAGREALRFFDLVTLAAAELFAAAGTEVDVFEAGIGGRLDATRILEPRVVALTSIGLDHTDLLGSSEAAILAEKLGVAPPGATVVLPPLGEPLDGEADRLAREGAYRLERCPVEGGFRERNALLARATFRRAVEELALGDRAERDFGLDVTARLQRGEADGVPFVVDSGHNEQGWRALLAELRGSRYVAVVSVGADKDLSALAGALRDEPVVEHAVATCAWPGRSLPAEELRRALPVPAEAVESPAEATLRGREVARERGLELLVFGTSYLAGHALAALTDPGRSS